MSNKIFKRCICLATVIILMLSLSLPAYAMKNKEPIRIGYINNYHYIYEDEDGKMAGYAVEWLEKISEITGWEYEYVLLSWPQIDSALQDGTIDFCCSAESITPGFRYSQIHIATAYELLYTLESSDVYYNDFATLDGKRIGVIKGSWYKQEAENYAKVNGFYWDVIEYSTAELKPALESGEVFAVLGDHIAPYNDYKVIGCIGAKTVYVKGAETSSYMDELNFAMSQVRAEDEYVNVNLYKKYYGDSTWCTSLNLTRQEAEYIASCGKISVGTFENRAPFSSYHASENSFDGINVAILNRISALSGLQFELRGISITTSATDALKNGQFDMAIGISRSVSFLEDPALKLSDPISANKLAVIGKSGEQIDMSTVRTMAIPTAYKSISLYAAEKFPQIQLKFYDSNYDCMCALQSGDAQIMVESDAVAKYLLQNPRFYDLAVYSALYLDQYSCIGTLADSNPCLISIINKTLSILSARELGEIELSYTSARNTEISTFDILYPNRVAILIAILLVGLLFMLLLLIRRFHRKQRESKVKMQIAQASNEAKSSFLARMSHDMRTPLNGILGLTSLAIDEVNDPKATLSDLNKIRDSGDFLLGLVNDVLDMSQIEKGAMHLNQEPYAYADFIGGVRTMFEPLCQQKKLNFVCDPNPMQETIITDKTRHNQIFFNILSNAVKYTPEGGTIIFRRENTERADETLTCDYVIEDTGIGMSAKFQKHMFESFSRESQVLTTGLQGSGLGLSIARSLVELMGGQLSIVSKLGKGTTVTIHLCYKLAQIPQSSPEEVLHPQIQQNLLEGKTVLLVEDHPLNAEIAARLLEKRKIIVVRAENGQSALEQFQVSAPHFFDAILMDIRMPVMNGLDATVAIRALDRDDARTVPIIAMTANAFDEDVRRSHDAGMNAHLAKPIVPEDLFKTLEQQIGCAAP